MNSSGAKVASPDNRASFRERRSALVHEAGPGVSLVVYPAENQRVGHDSIRRHVDQTAERAPPLGLRVQALSFRLITFQVAPRIRCRILRLPEAVFAFAEHLPEKVQSRFP